MAEHIAPSLIDTRRHYAWKALWKRLLSRPPSPDRERETQQTELSPRHVPTDDESEQSFEDRTVEVIQNAAGAEGDYLVSASDITQQERDPLEPVKKPKAELLRKPTPIRATPDEHAVDNRPDSAQA
jgi:hypothetical protein